MELFALECVRAQGRPRVCETASTAYLVPHGYGCCDSPKFMNLWPTPWWKSFKCTDVYSFWNLGLKVDLISLVLVPMPHIWPVRLSVPFRSPRHRPSKHFSGEASNCAWPHCAGQGTLRWASHIVNTAIKLMFPFFLCLKECLADTLAAANRKAAEYEIPSQFRKLKSWTQDLCAVCPCNSSRRPFVALQL